MGICKAVLAVLLVHLVLVAAEHGEKRERRSILVPGGPGFRPPYYPPPYLPGRYYRPRPLLPAFNMTAKETYDPATQICCHGNVFPYPKNSEKGCCNDASFDENKELCCGGVVNKLEPGFKCCGQTTYNLDNSMCCNGKVVAVSADKMETTECCGDQTYDTTVNLCCGGLRTQAKVMQKNSEDEFCCGMEVANSKTQACCSDLTLRGAGVVNTSFHVVSREADSNKTVCCWGGRLFDPASQSCCGTELVEGATQLCCGSKVIDPENQLCCMGQDGELAPLDGKRPTSRCCGSTIVDLEKQICCNNKVIEKTDPSLACCGDKTFVSKNEFCLLKVERNSSTFEVIKKTDPGQNAMCGEQPFNMRSEKCCPTLDGIKVTPKASDKSNLCCGDQTYEWNKATCCVDRDAKQFKLHSNVTGYFTDCCGLDTYDASKEICCGGKVKPRSKATMCCGGSATYDVNTDLCCMAADKGELKFAVMAKKGNTTDCCGLKSYDYTSHMCCNGNTYENDGKSLCCGDQSYNTEKNLCCGGNILPMKDKKSAACCYAGLGGKGGFNIDITVIKQTYYGIDRKR